MDNEKFGKFISEIRKERGMTQAELAEKINVTNKAVSKWERGVGFPDIKLLEPLADALDISIVEIMKSERIVLEPQKTYEAVDDALVNVIDVLKENRKKERRNIVITSLVMLMFFFLILVLDYIPLNSFIIGVLPYASFGIGICLLIMSYRRFKRKETYGLTLFCGIIAIMYPILMTLLVIYGFLNGASGAS